MAVSTEQLAEDMFQMVTECEGKKNLKAGDLTKARAIYKRIEAIGLAETADIAAGAKRAIKTGELAAERREPVSVRLVDAQRVSRVDGVREEIPDDLLVHGVPHSDVGPMALVGDEDVLRARGGPADQELGLRVLGQVIQEEKGGSPHHRESPFLEELRVSRE